MKRSRKYLWLKILLPLVLIFGSAHFLMPSDIVLKDLVVLEEVPKEINMDSVILVVTNRTVETSPDGRKRIGNEIDPEGQLRYFLAMESKNRFSLAFVDDMEDISRYAPEENLLVFVHGDGKTLQKTLWRASLMKGQYDASILVFSWPTRDPELNGLKNFRNSIENAKQTKEELAEFLEEYQETWDEGSFETVHRSTILFHSLGNFLLEETVKEGLLSDVQSGLFDNLILNAAAVESENHADWVKHVNMQDKLFIVSNTHDVNLKGAQYFTSLPILLGREVRGERVKGAEYIDVSDAMGFTFKRSPSHTYFVGDGMKIKNVSGFYHGVIDSKPMNWQQYGMRNKETGDLEIGDERS